MPFLSGSVTSLCQATIWMHTSAGTFRIIGEKVGPQRWLTSGTPYEAAKKLFQINTTNQHVMQLTQLHSGRGAGCKEQAAQPIFTLPSRSNNNIDDKAQEQDMMHNSITPQLPT